MDSSPPERTPRRIGKYDVLGELGHGGMAVVYRARDPQLLREVAIKVLHPHLSKEPESRRRFLREAQAAARLRHPNIVEVYDFSLEDDRESFMVSELLEGSTLRRFADAHPGMPAEVAAAIGAVLCDALGCAHAQGVVHRDVKPDNVLLQKGVLKLTDFGIAHVADGSGMTVTGQVLGSPAHMAPEQIEGAAVDARTDLFALGTVLYVLAVGRLPFDATTPHALLRKILESDYPDPVRVAPVVGHRFAALLRRCLAREPAQRPPSAAALREELCAFVAEAGWDAPSKQLEAYFADPEGFCTAHRESLLRTLPELGVAAREQGRLPDALGYFNRALALDPTNARVLGLVRGISRRRRVRRMLRAALTVGGAALVAGLAVLLLAGRLRGAGGPRAARRALALPAWVVARDDAASGDAGGARGAGDAGEGSSADAALAVDALVGRDDAGAAPGAGATASGEPATSDAGRGARVAPRPSATASVRPHSAPTDAGLATSAAPVRVELRFIPPGVSYSIDRGPMQAYDSERRFVELRPGPHRFRLAGTRPECDEDSWVEQIAPDTTVLRHRFVCRPRAPQAPAP